MTTDFEETMQPTWLIDKPLLIEGCLEKPSSVFTDSIQVPQACTPRLPKPELAEASNWVEDGSLCTIFNFNLTKSQESGAA